MKHDLPFDPTYGYNLESLLKVPAPEGPADFSEFWRQAHEKALAIPLRIERRQIASPQDSHDLFEIEFDSLDGVRIGGWITVPKDGIIESGFVCGHGYGGRESPGWDLPGPRPVCIFPCARGFHRSAHPAIPGNAVGHVIHGIQNRETYSHLGSAADIWCAASALLELYPQAAKNLFYHGSSFGGGIGALALPWEPRFKKGFLDVPSFGNHPIRITLPCHGSGESVRHYHRKHPEVMKVLAYFDSATAARHIHIPVFVAAAVFDPAVPPPGQFAVYNALAGPRELYVREAAHFGHSGEEKEYREIHDRLKIFFSKLD